MAGPEVAEAPAAGLFLVSAVLFVTAMSLIVLRFSTVVLMKALLHALVLPIFFIPVLGGIADSGIRTATHFVDVQLGYAIAASQGAAARTFNDAWHLTVWSARETALLAEDTAHALTTLVRSHIPLAIAAAFGPIPFSIEALREWLMHSHAHSIPQAIKQAEASAVKHATAEVDKIRAAVAAATAGAVAIPGTIGWDIPDVVGWARGKLGDLNARVGRLEKAVGIGAIAGVVVGLIAREFPWIRCRNMNRLGKQLCNTPVQDFERLLGAGVLGATLLTGTLDLKEFAREMQAVVGAAGHEMRVFLAATVPGESTSILP